MWGSLRKLGERAVKDARSALETISLDSLQAKFLPEATLASASELGIVYVTPRVLGAPLVSVFVWSAM
jgi:hypothetical protein